MCLHLVRAHLSVGLRCSKDAGTVLAGGARRGEAKHLLDVLSNAHGAQDVEEYEGAVRVIVPQQIAVTEALQPRDGGEGKVRHNSTFEN